MKIRTNFVSNSSSSSFIVKIKEYKIFPAEGDNKFIALEEDIKKIQEYGFKESTLRGPFDIDCYRRDNEIISFQYSVICNQDEVICFLIENNIPFKASIHYDNEYLSYKKDSNYIFVAHNYGIEIDKIGEDYFLNRKTKLKPIKKIFVKKWLKENKY
jgi:hypothetical protein